MKRRTRKGYSDTFKREVVAYRETHSLRQTSEKFGVHQQQIIRWAKKFTESLTIPENGYYRFVTETHTPLKEGMKVEFWTNPELDSLKEENRKLKEYIIKMLLKNE